MLQTDNHHPAGADSLLSGFLTSRPRMAVLFATGLFAAGLIVLATLAGMDHLSADHPPDRPLLPPTRGTAVLVFHRVGEGESVFPASELELLLKELRAAGYQMLSGAEFHRYLDGTWVPARPGVLLTFDDGYEDLFTVVHPILVRQRVPAMAMCVTKWLTPLPRPEPHFPHLSALQLQEMDSSGLWTFGCHSQDGHWLWTEGQKEVAAYMAALPALQRGGGQKETDAERAARVWADASLSRTTLEHALGKEIVDFAFPYGAIDGVAQQAVALAGFRYLYSMDPGLNRPGQAAPIKRMAGEKDAASTAQALQSLFATAEGAN